MKAACVIVGMLLLTTCCIGQVVRSGEVNLFRIPPEYLAHRIELISGLGLNSVSTYVPWNSVLTNREVAAYTQEQRLRQLFSAAANVGLSVILRPGPYICAEYDLGGMPWPQLKDRKLRFRSQHPGFLVPAANYLKEFSRIVAPFQKSRGGPVVMVQVENEYDGYGADDGYIAALCAVLREGGVDVPLYTSEMAWTLRPSKVQGLIRGIGFADQPERYFEDLRRIQPDGPLFCSELYTGWFDVWGRSTARNGGLERLTNTLERVISSGAWFNLYMAHGGTSFGFTAGANGSPYRPQPTSYDYGAPIDEAGRPTPKYFAIREVMARHLPPGQTLPPIPPANPIIAIPSVSSFRVASVLENLPTPRSAQRPITMEDMDQGHGCVLYRATVPKGGPCELVVTEPRDFTCVILDGRPVGTLNRMLGERSLWLPARDKDSTLDLLVEAMGHIHFGPEMQTDRKGITERVELVNGENRVEVLDWRIYQFPLGFESIQSLKFTKSSAGQGLLSRLGFGRSGGLGIIETQGLPAFYKATFELSAVGDTFLDMRSWSKGMVWVNGHNLGRFWNIGPQQTLYLPGPWLKKGDNEVVILDLLGPARAEVTGLTDCILDEVNLEATGRLHRRSGQTVSLSMLQPATEGNFAPGGEWQTVRFDAVDGRYVCLEALTSFINDGYSTCAELSLLDVDGREIPRFNWKIVYADSEEVLGEDGSASRILDGRQETFWHTRWDGGKDSLPHQVVIDLGVKRTVAGMAYLPRQDKAHGRIGAFRLFVRKDRFPGLE